AASSRLPMPTPWLGGARGFFPLLCPCAERRLQPIPATGVACGNARPARAGDAPMPAAKVLPSCPRGILFRRSPQRFPRPGPPPSCAQRLAEDGRAWLEVATDDRRTVRRRRRNPPHGSG